MAFCNSCGANLEPGAKFCPKCGTGVPAAAAVVNPPSTAASTQSNSAIKLILIVVAVLVCLGIIGAVTTAIVGWRVARHTRVAESGGKVRVETPFGTVESNENSDEVIRSLGIDVYPGARALKGNAASVTTAGMHTVSAEFETDDPPEKVAEFYKPRLPHANISITDEKNYTFVSTENKNFITVNIEPQEGKTLIHIANVTGKAVAGAASTD
jgi:hypothetical protein